MTHEFPDRLNIADLFLDARLAEGRGDRPAILTDDRVWSYAEVAALANRYGNLLLAAGADPEDRILIALPDGPDYAGALFGALKIGAVVVMANPGLAPAEIGALLEYTRARIVLAGEGTAAAFAAAAEGSRVTRRVLAVGGSSSPASCSPHPPCSRPSRPTPTIPRSGSSRAARPAVPRR